MNTVVNMDGSEIVQEENVGKRAVNYSAGSVRSDVSKQWINRPADERFLTLADLADAKGLERSNSEAYAIANKQVTLLAPEVRTLDDTNKLSTKVFGRGDEFGMTPWAFNQIAGLVKAPSKYLRSLPSQIVADNLNWGLQRNRAVEEIKPLLTGTENGPVLRAVTGPNYGRIWDHEVVKAVQGIADQGHWKVPGVMDWGTGIYDPDAPITSETTTLFASDRDVFIFLVDDKRPIIVGELPDGSPDYMFRGFWVSNSEVGLKSFSVAAMYLRSICCNRILWGVEGFQEVSIRHSSGAPSRFAEEIRPALESYAEKSDAKLIEAVADAKAATVAKDDEEALEFLRGRDFSRSNAQAIFDLHEKEEGRPIRSAWDAAQGITAFARDIPNSDNRLRVEANAGRILNKVA